MKRDRANADKELFTQPLKLRDYETLFICCSFSDGTSFGLFRIAVLSRLGMSDDTTEEMQQVSTRLRTDPILFVAP